MKKASEAAKYAVIVLLVSVVSAFESAAYFYGNANYSEAFIKILVNNFDSAVVIGIPALYLTGGAGIPYAVTGITDARSLFAPRLRKRTHCQNHSLRFRFMSAYIVSGAVLTVSLTFAVCRTACTTLSDGMSRALTAAGYAANVLFLCAPLFGRFVNAAVEPIRKAAADMEEFSMQFESSIFSEKEADQNDLCETERLSEALKLMKNSLTEHMAAMERSAAEKEHVRVENELADRMQTCLQPINGKFAYRGVEADIFAQTKTCGQGRGISYDFYDFFMTDDRHAALLIAESSLKGVSAAMFFLAVRQMIRNAAGGGKSPAEVLSETSRKMCGENSEDMIVSLWLGLLELDTGKLTYSGAAHDPPIITHGRKCRYLNSDVNIFFACLESSSFREQCEYLGRNDMLFLYSGGIVGAKDRDGVPYGADRLFGEASGCGNLSPKTAVLRVLKSVNSFCGTAEQTKDMTLLAVKINHRRAMTVQAEKENIKKLSDFAESCLARLKCPEDKIVSFKIAIDEAAANVCGYAYPDGKTGTVTLKCLYERKKRRYSVIISDSGVPFNPILAPRAKLDGTAGERKIGGLGIHIIKELTDDVRYRYSGGKNILTMSIKDKKASALQ